MVMIDLADNAQRRRKAMHPIQKKRLTACATAMLATGWHAAGFSQELARSITILQQQQIRAIQISDEEKAACKKALEERAKLFATQTSDETQLKALAKSAYESRQQCERARKNAEDTRLQIESSWELLNSLASAKGPAKDSAAKPDPPAAVAQVGQKPALPAPLVVPKGTKELIEAAAKAQAQVDKARSDYADPFVDPDSATSRLLGNHALEKGARDALTTETREAREAALSVRESIRAAQAAANRLTDYALTLKGCHPACPDAATHGAADQAHTELTAALLAAKTAFEKGKQAALAVSVGIAYPKPSDASKRRDARAFAELMDKFPDASSLVGEASAFKVTAAGSGSAANIKLGNARDLPRGWRQMSFTLSVPLSAATNPQVLSRNDGFNDAARLGFSSYRLHAGDKDVLLSSDSHLTASGFKGSWGMGNKASYLDADLKTRRTTERAFREGSLGGYVALFARPGEHQNTHSVHLVSMDIERKLDRGKQEVRCPSQAATGSNTLTCVNDYFTEPKFTYSRKLGYEFRYQTAKWALAPKLVYDDEAHTTSARLPLYWILSEDTKGGSSYSAGLDVQWNRARRATDGKTKTESSFGLFVSMPFSLYAVDR